VQLQKQQRREIGGDGLGDEPQITGGQRFSVILFHDAPPRLPYQPDTFGLYHNSLDISLNSGHFSCIYDNPATTGM
jgi:hypothetical protein